MTKTQRKELREKIISTINEITADNSNRESTLTIGGHHLARRLMYAGGSQWSGCGRDWDRVESGWGWTVDSRYHLTTPGLFGFDGHNMIERQTAYYLQDGYDEQTTPQHDNRDPLDRVPNPVLLEIGRGLVEAQKKAAEAEAQSSHQAADILTALA